MLKDNSIWKNKCIKRKSIFKIAACALTMAIALSQPAAVVQAEARYGAISGAIAVAGTGVNAGASANAKAAALTFEPLPYENPATGRNNNAYNPALGHPTEAEKEAFVEEIKVYAVEAQKKWHLPASAIVAMAIKESGYGYTRIAVNANNLFGIKVYRRNPQGAWQLKGQPYEGDGNPSLAKVISARYGTDRIVYKEWLREDNWYRAFGSRKEAVDYLAGTLLQNERYKPALDKYKQRIAEGWSYEAASSQYIYDIAAAGYCSLGPSYYRNEVVKFMAMWQLY